MKIDVKTLGLPVLALCLAAPGLRAQAPTKVAIINIQGAILATKDGDKARQALSTKFEGRTKGMESRAAEINKLREQLSKGANTMSADAREKLTRDIEDKQKRYQWDAEDLQNEIQQEEQKVVSEIGQRVVAIIDEYAKASGFALVLDVSSQQSPVLWAAAGIDISNEIVQLYDKKHGGDAAAAPPAAATKPATVPAPKPAAPKK